ncbi:MAG TPA: monovalent cation/H+ antiporter complex subunit F [Vicinamibacteria bacterium]|nr:monovalent cation/H+ antiporter complex subunit F [Vicinamibacteria bacterium]
MQHLVHALAVGLALVMLMSFYRLLRGPTIWDRLSGLGLLGTKTIVLLLLLGLATGREDIFVDITLSYTLISFVGSLALAKYFEGKESPPAETRHSDVPSSGTMFRGQDWET